MITHFGGTHLMASQAFQLRKATTDDFSTFYNYHVHFCYHWLYLDEIATKVDNPFDKKYCDEEFEDNYFFSKEDLIRIHNEIINFNIHDFENHLKWYRIFMIIIQGKVVGYVKLENYCRQFIIREWTMHYDYMTPELLTELLKKFETFAPKKSTRIQVISMGTPTSKDFLEANGYKAKHIPFFEKEL